MTYASDLFEIGKQSARLAHQILQGVKPADLPIETSDFYLTINLKTAEAIGLDIPDISGILADRPVTGELAGSTDVKNRLAGPTIGILIKAADRVLGFHVGLDIREVQITISVIEQRRPDRIENPGLVWAKMI